MSIKSQRQKFLNCHRRVGRRKVRTMTVKVGQRGRGRPRVGDCRLEMIVPRAVMEVIIAREQCTNVYRTRIAANVLCEWASRTTGKNIRPYDSV